jgi:hypothetical protein
MNSEDILERQRLAEMITKTEEEENRYSKAYGAGALAFEQFQELMKGTKKRKISYQKQLANLADKSVQTTVKIEVDELIEEVKKMIGDLDFTDKFKVIRDIIDKVVVSERSGAEVWAHLPLPTIITEKLGYESERRNSGITKRRQIDAF